MPYFKIITTTMAAAIILACGGNPTDANKTDIEKLREATAAFKSLEAAAAAGYSAELTSCWYHASQGGMGYHVGNPDLIDATVELTLPEALMYEPLPGGDRRFVGVEYIVPIAAWDGTSPPALHGRNFSRNEAMGLYTLHVWAWKENPSGVFADWNPAVSCSAAEVSEDRSASLHLHH